MEFRYPVFQIEVLNLVLILVNFFIKAFGTKVILSIAFHLQIDGQAKHTIQTLEDVLRDYVIDRKESWDDHLTIIKFTYNNRYHASSQMAPFKPLY